MSHTDFMRLINPADPFALVDTPWGQLEAWRAATLATGTMGCLTEVYAQVRNDAAELSAREKEHASRADAELTLARDVLAKLDALNTRLSRLEDAQEEREREAKVDAERELAELEEIELPPGVEELGEGDPMGDDTHHPSGDLHSVPPSNETNKEKLAALSEDDGTDDDGEGDLPNELLETAPPSGGTMPTPDLADLAHPPTATPRQTVAPSFW